MGGAPSAQDDLEAPHAAVVDDPGVVVPGISSTGDTCSCIKPPLNMRALHDVDKEYLESLDTYTIQALVSKKDESQEIFDVGFQRTGASKQRLDKTLADLVANYTNLSKKRHDLELAQSDMAFSQITHCRPLKDKLGLFPHCQDDFNQAMTRYRELHKDPTCAVGASLPLAPASFAPSADMASDAANGVAAALAARHAWAGRSSARQDPPVGSHTCSGRKPFGAIGAVESRSSRSRSARNRDGLHAGFL